MPRAPGRSLTRAAQLLPLALVAGCASREAGDAGGSDARDGASDASAAPDAPGTPRDATDVDVAGDDASSVDATSPDGAAFPDALGDGGVDARDGAAGDGGALVLAVIGDYGVCGAYQRDGGATEYAATCADERAVARMVHAWHPAAVITTGDNSYGSAASYQIPGDQAPYDDLITARVFFAAFGNHDWFSPISNSLSYFHLAAPHYTQSFGGLLTAYILDTNPEEPDGDLATSAQARAYTPLPAASRTPWNIAVNHQAPYSSCGEGSYDGHDATHPDYRWVAAPGIDVVLSGHSHVYERLAEPDARGMGSVPHIVIGASGAPLQGDCGVRLPGQQAAVYRAFGALRLTVTARDLLIEFVDEAGMVRDRLALHKGP